MGIKGNSTGLLPKIVKRINMDTNIQNHIWDTILNMLDLR